ncbi:MAG TPA: GlsB/YeaQ/YmgE family stress response membrane protein [Chloroflexia bacterium]|nr:GlsB/YeaQ/YmgE family stress response membrane protein [Chloroflexia bacterium]
MSVTQLIIYLVIAAIVGLLAERLVGAGPWGLIGNIVVGLLGIWVMLNVIKFQLSGDPVIGGVPIITSILGAILVDVVLSLIMRGRGPRRTWSRRRI